MSFYKEPPHMISKFFSSKEQGLYITATSGIKTSGLENTGIIQKSGNTPEVGLKYAKEVIEDRSSSSGK